MTFIVKQQWLKVHSLVLAGFALLLLQVLQGCSSFQSQPTDELPTKGLSLDAIEAINQLPPTAAGTINVANWTAADIGSSTLAAGSTTTEGSTITVKGSGDNIWKKHDGFHFFYSPLVGNGDIVVKIDDIDYVHPWSKAGVMVRESLSPSSPYVMLLVTPDRGLALQYRSAEGEISYKTTYVETVKAPTWMKLTRIDNTVLAFNSTDGEQWSVIGAVDINLKTNAYLGLAVSSREPSILSTAHFSNLSVSAASTQLSNAIEKSLALTEKLVAAFTTQDSADRVKQLETALVDSQSIPDLVDTALTDLKTEAAAVEHRATFDSLYANANTLLTSMSEKSSAATIAQAETLVATLTTLAETLNDNSYAILAQNISTKVDVVKDKVEVYGLNADYTDMASELKNLLANIENGQTESIDEATTLAASLSEIAASIGSAEKISAATTYITTTADLAKKIEAAKVLAQLNALIAQFDTLKSALSGVISNIEAGQYYLLADAKTDAADLVTFGSTISSEKEKEAQALATSIATLAVEQSRTVLSWETPALRTDGAVLPVEEIYGFVIHYTLNGVDQPAITITKNTTTSYEFKSLIAGEYVFSIRTLDTNTLQSPASTEVDKTVY